MKKYQENLQITQADTTDYSELEEVGGNLYVYSNADLKNLKSVGGYLSVYSNVDFKAPLLKSVGGYLYVYSNVDFKAPLLKSVGGDLYVNSKIPINVAKNLWSANRKKNTKWYISNEVPEWLIKRVATKSNTEFRINNLVFNFEWFEKIRKDKLTAEEVFAIDNIEHRRIAYEFMDKSKMKALKDYKVLDEGIDEKGKPVKIISFNIQNMKEDLIFYNCVDASTGREYFLQTDKKTWKEAKDSSFGLKDVKWVNEW